MVSVAPCTHTLFVPCRSIIYPTLRPHPHRHPPSGHSLDVLLLSPSPLVDLMCAPCTHTVFVLTPSPTASARPDPPVQDNAVAAASEDNATGEEESTPAGRAWYKTVSCFHLLLNVYWVRAVLYLVSGHVAYIIHKYAFSAA